MSKLFQSIINSYIQNRVHFRVMTRVMHIITVPKIVQPFRGTVLLPSLHFRPYPCRESRFIVVSPLGSRCFAGAFGAFNPRAAATKNGRLQQVDKTGAPLLWLQTMGSLQQLAGRVLAKGPVEFTRRRTFIGCDYMTPIVKGDVMTENYNQTTVDAQAKSRYLMQISKRLLSSNVS